MKRRGWMAVCCLSVFHLAVYAQSTPQAPASGAMAFSMTWQAGGAGRRENMNVGSRRVYEIELQSSPPQGAESLAAPDTRYGVIQFADGGHSSFVCGLRKPPTRPTGHESFFVDLNHNGSLEEGETLPPKPVFEGLTALEYGSVDLTLQGAAGPRKHRIYVHMNKFGPLYIASHCYMQGRLALGDRQVEAVLVDYNCDGRYAPGKVKEEDIGSLGPRELDYDLIGWDANGDGKIEWIEQHYIGSYAIQGDKVYRIDCSPDGLTVTVTPRDLPMGRLQMPGKNAFVRLIGPLGPFNLLMPDGVGLVPAGVYRVEYALVCRTADLSGETSFRKSGPYFEKPWTIRAGETTTIEPNELVVTAADEQRLQEKIKKREQRRLDPPVQSLLHTPLGDLSRLGIHLDGAEDQRILLCFFDAGQRPSRHCFVQVIRQYGQLREKNIAVAAVNVATLETPSIQEWLDAQNAPFPVGAAKSDSEQTRLKWGFRSLPWVILTDTEHVVIAEGFALQELNNRLE
jgi:hypothetical protein